MQYRLSTTYLCSSVAGSAMKALGGFVDYENFEARVLEPSEDLGN
jgi:hypothetical protein